MCATITRRHFLGSAAALLALPDTNLYAAPAAEEFPPLPPNLVPFADQPDYFNLITNSQNLGTAKPTPDEEKVGAQVLAAAPFDCPPVHVALYFLKVGQGKWGTGKAPYARGWPIRYNPVIIEFFHATATNPLDPTQDGDATYWCAAFVNWCIARGASKSGNIGSAELAKSTHSASSGSFRCWNSIASAPKRGDVVVWQAPNSAVPCPSDGKLIHAKGHVAFFLGAADNEHILVVGGNQRLGNPTQHGVTQTTISRSYLGGLHSIRSIST